MIRSRDRSIVRDLDLARWWREPPAVSSPTSMAWTFASLYLLGSALLLLCSLVLDWGGTDPRWVAAIGVMCAPVGLALVLTRARLPRWCFQALLVLATGLLTALVTLGNGGSTSVALNMGFVFIAVDSAFLFAPRAATVHLLIAPVASSLALAHVGVSAGDIVVIESCTVIVAILVAWLARVADAVEEDPLTGLLNRRGFDRRVEGELHHPAGDGARQLSLVLLDLDDFKRVNELDGHQSGDRLLVACARAWRPQLVSGASLARYDSDVFALLLPDTPLGRAADVADQLRRTAPSRVTVSAGVAGRYRGDSGSILMSRADVALYEAKSAGRDQTVVYGDPGRAASELETAVAAGQLRLHFQPLVRLSSRKVIGFEALVRWQHPVRGLVGPGRFIPQAERTGAIHSIGAWLRGEVCRMVMTTPGPRRPVSVNVSVHELRRPDFAKALRDLLEEWSMPGELMIVEVTESAFDDDDPQVVRSLQGLRALGVRVSIDDFGSGYSSLRRLGSLPIDIIKLDGALVESIPDSGYDAPILEAIVSMGRSLGVRLVAERVETVHQAEVLRRLGYELGQGFLFSRPEPWQEVAMLTVAEEAAVDSRS